MAAHAIWHMGNPQFKPFSIQVRQDRVSIRQTVFEPTTKDVEVATGKLSLPHQLAIRLLAMKALISDLSQVEPRRDDGTIPQIPTTPSRPSHGRGHKHGIEHCLSNYEQVSAHEWVCDIRLRLSV